MMCDALGVKEGKELAQLSGASKQTQFDYLQQIIFEQTGEQWEWKGAPKDGEWIRVSNATIAAPLIPSAETKKPKTKTKSKHTRENLTALTTADLRKIYRDTVPFSDRNSEKHTKAEYATKEFMIEAILKA